MSPFPIHRSRRLRKNGLIRSLIRENELSVTDLVSPLFVIDGKNLKKPIRSMPGVFQYSIDLLVREAKELAQLGVPALMLFGVTKNKDADASYGYSDQTLVSRAIETLKEKVPEILVIADVCLCGYTDHGHCGVLKKEEIEDRKEKTGGKRERFVIDNDATLEVLSKIAGGFARAGADMIAPSDMMDGRVQKIRDELDAAGYKETPILSYAVKYASAFYGPFREAASSSPSMGDRSSYQMDSANLREAIREAELDLEEGADILMVKPALAYLDVIQVLRTRFSNPVAAYQVSGEYSMIKAAAVQGWIDEKKVVYESLLSMKRAGADFIVTYFAKEMAKTLKK